MSWYALKYCSSAFALEKRIGTYYYSDAYGIEAFKIPSTNSSTHDLLSMALLSTSQLKLYSSGIETKRIDKEIAFNNWSYPKKYLTVCTLSQTHNCGHCFNCKCTMAELYTIGALKDYSDRFPVSDFLRHRLIRIAFIVARAWDNSILEKDTVRRLKTRKPLLLIASYPIAALFYIYLVARHKLKTIPFVKKLYDSKFVEGQW